MTRNPAMYLAVFLVLPLVFGGCQEEIAGPEATSESVAAPDMQNAHGPPHQPAQQATLSQQLNTVRAVTKKYRDIEAARADDYFAVSPYVPGMGFHFATSVPPFGSDRSDPPVLVYFTNGSYNPDPGESHEPARDDDLILGAVEWIVPGNQEDDPPNIFNDEASPRHLKTTEEEGWHFESGEGFTGLHAWVHRGNPAGVFHPTNPTIE